MLSLPLCLRLAVLPKFWPTDFKVRVYEARSQKGGLPGSAHVNVIASSFLVWRKVLKDLITYFRDIQKSYDSRSKALFNLSNVITNIAPPRELVAQGGINDAVHILQDYHKQSITEGNKARSIEEEVIMQLTGLRSDLGQKIKEIKSLSGDFKNNVDKETESTRRAVRELQDAISNAGSGTRSDPFLIRLGVDRQVGKQIEEENYLHRVGTSASFIAKKELT